MRRPGDNPAVSVNLLVAQRNRCGAVTALRTGVGPNGDIPTLWSTQGAGGCPVAADGD